MRDGDDPLPLHSPNWRPTEDSIDLLYRQLRDAELALAELNAIQPRQKWVEITGDPPRLVHRLVRADEVRVTVYPTRMTGPATLEEGWRDEIEFEVNGEPREGRLFDWKPDFDKYYGAFADPGSVKPAVAAADPAAPPPPPAKRKGGKKPLVVWNKVQPHFDDLVKSDGPFPSLGSARDAVKLFLEEKGLGLPNDRTIERRINTHWPHWFKGGVRGA